MIDTVVDQVCFLREPAFPFVSVRTAHVLGGGRAELRRAGERGLPRGAGRDRPVRAGRRRLAERLPGAITEAAEAAEG
ncbi:hypothetical protein AB0D66_32005 [Streptomyces sp. NPDC048270]|uniref:hypothetical protein n=1 Tax=Streptomyces sp. NPDC048270 TaxID=3154615 RepID=UPI0033E4B3A5